MRRPVSNEPNSLALINDTERRLRNQIARKKRKANKLARSLNSDMDSADCGKEMLRQLRAGFATREKEYNKTIAWLKKHDPNFPKTVFNSGGWD